MILIIQMLFFADTMVLIFVITFGKNCQPWTLCLWCGVESVARLGRYKMAAVFVGILVIMSRKMVIVMTASAKEGMAMTNADKIRAMSDEKLAQWLTHIEMMALVKKPYITRSEMFADWLDWLKQEVRDE